MQCTEVLPASPDTVSVVYIDDESIRAYRSSGVSYGAFEQCPNCRYEWSWCECQAQEIVDECNGCYNPLRSCTCYNLRTIWGAVADHREANANRVRFERRSRRYGEMRRLALTASYRSRDTPARAKRVSWYRG
jgi:hypothetical protein